MQKLIESLGPGQILLLLIGLALAGASMVNTIGSAAEKLSKFWRTIKAPEADQDVRLKTLEAWREEFTETFKDLEQELEELKKHHEDDMDESREERQLIVYGLLSCLKGLQEQGCDGPVSEAINKFEKHLNAKAHQR